jgi:peptide/nickel transport system substrate-binding protein
MDEIANTGIPAFGRHGANAGEKDRPQRWISRSRSRSDRLAATIDYAGIHRRVVEIVRRRADSGHSLSGIFMTPFQRSRAWRIFAFALAAGMLAACSHGVAQRDDTVRIAFPIEPSSLNPLLSTTQAETIVNQAIYSGLLRFDDSGKLLPDAASRVPTVSDGISADGRTITYHLRPNVFWHDGTRLTAADVAFTFARIKDPAVNLSFGFRYANVISVVAKNPYTVEVHLRRPFVDALDQIFVNGRNGGPILPKHLLEHHSNLNQDPFNARPVGSGPYTLGSWNRGNALTLIANRSYFGGAPRIPRVRLDFVPNAASAFGRVRTQEDDIANIPADLAHRINAGDATIERYPAHVLTYLTLNMRSPNLRDVRVRQALAASVDRKDIVRTAYLGEAVPAYGMIPPGVARRLSLSLPPQRPDLALAKRLLASHRRDQGRPISLRLIMLSGNAPFEAIAVRLQQTWRDLGVEVSIKSFIGNHLYAADGPLANGQFDIALGGYSFDSTPDRRMLLTPESFPPGYNRARYDNPIVTRDETAGEETRDRRRRASFYDDVEARVRADVPYVPLVWPNSTYITDRRVAGFRPGTSGSFFWNVQDWRLRR